MTKLNERQRRFAREFIVDPNATQAAIRAGYSKRTAYEIGRKLLKKVEIAAAINKGQARLAAKVEVTAEKIIAELVKIGFSNMMDYMRVGPAGDPVLDFSKITRDQAAALTEVTVEDFLDGRADDKREVRRVKFKLADKRAALVDLGKHLGMFVERTEHTGAGGGPIEFRDARQRVVDRIRKEVEREETT